MDDTARGLAGERALAVHPELTYVRVETGDESVWVAEPVLERVAPGGVAREQRLGRELSGCARWHRSAARCRCSRPTG